MITNTRLASLRMLRCWRRIFCSLLVSAAIVAFVGTIAISHEPAVAGEAGLGHALQLGKIAPWVMEHTANDQQAEFFVVLTDQADLSQATGLQTKAEKAQFVYNALSNKAQATQRPVLQWLRDRGLEYRSFYIVNAILIKGSREIAKALAARPDVARVEGNPRINNQLPRPESSNGSSSSSQEPATIEPGIAYTHAPDVWGLGFTGQD